MKCRLASTLLVLILALSLTALAMNTWYVDGVNGNDSNSCTTPETACKTIGHAISLASSGDSIMVTAATYTENLIIGISLKVHGASASTTIIDGNSTGRVITISSANAQITLSNITIRNGNGNGQGGGIYNSGTLTVNYSTISGNRNSNGNGQGGGIYNNGTLTVNHSTISGNGSASGRGGFGGGIYNSSRLTINATTISGNGVGGEGSAYGGGIFNSGSVTINNSTLSGNGAECGNILQHCYSGGGGGIYNAGVLVISNSTLSGNNAQENWQNFVPLGGGIYNAGTAGTLSLQNSILADNRVIQAGNHELNAPSNCHGPITSDGYNLSSDTTCTFDGLGDLNNTEPELGALGNHGGPTQTIPEMLGSPTVDAGNPNGCTDSQGHLLTTDQRGYPRPGKYKHDKRCDMGAYERQTD